MAARGVAQALAEQVLPAVLTATPVALGDTLYVALSTVIPTGDGTGFTPPVGGAYVSVAVPRTGAWWHAHPSIERRWSNAQTVTFPTPTADWGRIAAYGVFASDGRYLWGEALATTQNVASGAVVAFAADTLGLAA